MSTIHIQDLSASHALDRHAMAGLRGGIAMPNVNVNLNLDQKIGQFQNIQVDVLNNNGVIGAGFTAPRLALSPTQWGVNDATLAL
jgi:hypothetical protein